jgi:hypothetical protein
MKWFLMAIMTQVYSDNSLDTYIWYNPVFDNQQQCVEYVKQNNDPIYFTLMREFPNDELHKLLCVQEDKLKKFLELNEAERDQRTKT